MIVKVQLIYVSVGFQSVCDFTACVNQQQLGDFSV